MVVKGFRVAAAAHQLCHRSPLPSFASPFLSLGVVVGVMALGAAAEHPPFSVVFSCLIKKEKGALPLLLVLFFCLKLINNWYY